jgi:hypothetical protein
MGFYFWLCPGMIDNIATGGTLAVGTAALALYIFQRRLIYVPNFPPGSRNSVWKPSQFGWKNFDDVWLRSKDDTKIHSFWIPNSTSDGTRAVPTIYFCQVFEEIY